MPVEESVRRAEPPPRLLGVAGPVVGDYVVSHLGFFAVLPVLPLVLGQLAPDAPPWFLGLGLFVFNFAVRGASLFCSGLLHRLPVRAAMAGGLLLAGAGLGLLPWAPGPVGLLACLLVAGTGISTNGLVARVYVALSLPTAAARNTVFSAVQVAVNVSAALGPLLANLLLGRGLLSALMLVVAGCYAVAALVVGLALPRGLRPSDRDRRPPLRLGLLRDCVRDPDVRALSLVTAAGGFLYAQFFSAVVLQVARVTEVPLLRGAVFTLNAVLVATVQIPVSLYVARRLRAGTPPLAFLRVGIAAFAAGFVVLAASGSTLAGVLAGVTVFSVAETVFTPMVSTAFGHLPGDRPAVEAFNLRQVAATAGESLGAFAGGALYLAAQARHATPAYWIAVALLGVVAAVTVRRAATAQPAPGAGS